MFSYRHCIPTAFPSRKPRKGSLLFTFFSNKNRMHKSYKGEEDLCMIGIFNEVRALL